MYACDHWILNEKKKVEPYDKMMFQFKVEQTEKRQYHQNPITKKEPRSRMDLAYILN